MSRPCRPFNPSWKTGAVRLARDFKRGLPPGWNMQSFSLLMFSSNVFPQPVRVQTGIASDSNKADGDLIRKFENPQNPQSRKSA
jgi:hypothetical protein